MLRVKDREFKTNECIFFATIDDENSLSWNFRVSTYGQKFDEFWEPVVSGENMLIKLPQADVIVGETVAVPDAYDPKSDKYFFTMYVFEHEDMYQNRIKFLQRRNNIFQILWTAKCNINWDEEYGQGLDVCIDANIEFKGITTQTASLAEAKSRLDKHYSSSSFEAIANDEGHISFRLPE